MLFKDPNAMISTLGVTVRRASAHCVSVCGVNAASTAPRDACFDTHAPPVAAAASSPVLVKTLADFGTLEEVTAKLVAAERDKARTAQRTHTRTRCHDRHDCTTLNAPRAAQESTVSVEVLSSRERRAASGATLYEIDYLLDSSRGKKRVINAVCIDAATLYIYALQFKARGGRC